MSSLLSQLPLLLLLGGVEGFVRLSFRLHGARSLAPTGRLEPLAELYPHSSSSSLFAVPTPETTQEEASASLQDDVSEEELRRKAERREKMLKQMFDDPETRANAVLARELHGGPSADEVTDVEGEKISGVAPPKMLADTSKLGFSQAKEAGEKVYPGEMPQTGMDFRDFDFSTPLVARLEKYCDYLKDRFYKRNVYIMGIPWALKKLAGRFLAEKLGMGFWDLEEEVARVIFRDFTMSLNEFKDTFGPSEYMRQEYNVLSAMAQEYGQIVVTTEMTPTYPQNWMDMHSGVVLALNFPDEVAFASMKQTLTGELQDAITQNPYRKESQQKYAEKFGTFVNHPIFSEADPIKALKERNDWFLNFVDAGAHIRLNFAGWRGVNDFLDTLLTDLKHYVEDNPAKTEQLAGSMGYSRGGRMASQEDEEVTKEAFDNNYKARNWRRNVEASKEFSSAPLTQTHRVGQQIAQELERSDISAREEKFNLPSHMEEMPEGYDTWNTETRAMFVSRDRAEYLRRRGLLLEDQRPGAELKQDFPHLGGAEGFNRGKTSDYLWQQTYDQVSIYVPVAENHNFFRTDVKMKVKRSHKHRHHLKLEVGGKVIVDDNIRCGINRDSWFWTLDYGPGASALKAAQKYVRVDLEKLVKGLDWKDLLLPQKRIDDMLSQLSPQDLIFVEHPLVKKRAQAQLEVEWVRGNGTEPDAETLMRAQMILPGEEGYKAPGGEEDEDEDDSLIEGLTEDSDPDAEYDFDAMDDEDEEEDETGSFKRYDPLKQRGITEYEASALRRQRAEERMKERTIKVPFDLRPQQELKEGSGGLPLAQEATDSDVMGITL